MYIPQKSVEYADNGELFERPNGDLAYKNHDGKVGVIPFEW